MMYLSSETQNVIDRIESDGPWENLQGDLVFANREAIRSGTLSASFAVDETGVSLFDFERFGEDYNLIIWDGSDELSRRQRGFTCRNWSSASEDDFGGIIFLLRGREALWNDDLLSPCDELRHVFCLER